MLSSLHDWQWVILAVGAFALGVSKTGVPGLGILAVAAFALALPSRVSTGVVLPLLICGDIVAVSSYRRHAVWSHLWRLLPWAGVGVVFGWLALSRVDDRQVAGLIGTILIVLVVLQAIRKISPRNVKQSLVADTAQSRRGRSAFGAVMGLLAGFTTMVANAAGPIMVLYLLASGLPKMEFIGTGAWYFLLVNASKIPFSVALRLINLRSLALDACLVPAVLAGALVGRKLLGRLNQDLFENLALGLTAVAAARLIFQYFAG